MICLMLPSCSDGNKSVSGTLYIIGGGDKTEEMINELVDLSGIRENGYMYVLPMASSVPDSAIMWAREDFVKAGAGMVPGYAFRQGEIPLKTQIDSLRNARLIYISGGDQSRFMSVVLNTPIMDAIQEAYKNGSVIAGTSAGAAVMSKKMITGNQKKHRLDEAGFTTIEAENIEITEGLGLLENVIIDQHFIKRQRLNRLVAASIENPAELCVGIDESTAIVVKGKSARVTGVGQVVTIRNQDAKKTVQEGLLGTEKLEVSVFL
ncbi:MAG: cyanophycinase, partial [Bacteroidia bacterium]